MGRRPGLEFPRRLLLYHGLAANLSTACLALGRDLFLAVGCAWQGWVALGRAHSLHHSWVALGRAHSQVFLHDSAGLASFCAKSLSIS